jgi:hypothetical protein
MKIIRTLQPDLRVLCECINAAVMYIIDIPDTDAACQKTGIEIMGEKRIHEGGWFQSRRNPASELVVLNVPGKKTNPQPTCQLICLQTNNNGWWAIMLDPK